MFSAASSVAIKSSFIGAGAGDDIMDFAGSADICTDIHLGKGSDTFYFNTNDVGSATG